MMRTLMITVSVAALIASAAPGALDAIKKQAGSEIFKRLQESGAVSEAGILSFILITFLPLMLGLGVLMWVLVVKQG